MLLLPESVQKQRHEEAKEGVTNHFNKLLENILVQHQDKDKYWILGKASKEKHNHLDVLRPFLQACMEKPGIVRDSFVYEIDNTRGTKTLLWVMYPGDLLYFPTLKKSICVSNNKGVTILPPK